MLTMGGTTGLFQLVKLSFQRKYFLSISSAVPVFANPHLAGKMKNRCVFFQRLEWVLTSRDDSTIE